MKPITAKSLIPQWYKDAEATWNDSKGESNPGLKSCIPVLDALVSGYFLLTSVNIYIKKDEKNNILIEYDDENINNIQVIQERPSELGATIPRPAGHLQNHLVWTSNWSWKTPRGYSILITHPLNGWHLPFTTMSAIVDSDKFHGPGNVPFFLKENFEGIIPKGTPYAQVIPIKRKKWIAAHTPKITDYALLNGIMNMHGFYKKDTWVKKIYYTEENNERK